MEEKEEKILYLSTHGDEKPDKASIPFVLANAALAMEVKATVVVAKKGGADDIPASGGFPPMKKLVSDFVELGGSIWVCGPCIKERNIDPSELIDGAEVTAAAQVNIAALEADAVFVY